MLQQRKIVEKSVRKKKKIVGKHFKNSRKKVLVKEENSRKKCCRKEEDGLKSVAKRRKYVGKSVAKSFAGTVTQISAQFSFIKMLFPANFYEFHSDAPASTKQVLFPRKQAFSNQG